MISRDVLPSGIGTSLSKPVIDINQLIRLKLPPLNRTVLRVSELLRDPNVSTRKLAGVVGCDPVLAARLLKLANSCLFFRQAPVISIQQAIEAVGLKALYDIVMLGAMADGFAKEISNTVYGRQIWEHSIVVALIAREISGILGLRGTEEAFLCGLLHDIGKILLLKGETEKFESILDATTEAGMLKGEEGAFGLTHAEVGAFVTHKWELPEVVTSVIMNHHRPRFATISTVTTYVVNAADQVANLHGYGLRLDSREDVLISDSVQKLRLSEEHLETAWGNIQNSLLEVLATFR
ncbi:MAG: HDOD domain-containing protein [Acidobacteria bacterium]|nr:HDOD domain-containing protein [Acidobacteriota bacterium]